MDVQDAMVMARRALWQFDLDERGWTVKLDRAPRRFGRCVYSTKTISLSEVLVELNDEGEVLDTILHEVAHALAGSGHGHGPVWKAWCRITGARPERCFGSNVVQPPARYTLMCEACSFTAARHRKSRGSFTHAAGHGTLVWIDNKEGA